MPTVLGLPVGVIKVEGGQRTCAFAKQADFVRTVRRGHFTAAQLPPTVTTAEGKTIAKPREWRPRRLREHLHPVPLQPRGGGVEPASVLSGDEATRT